MIEYKEKKKRYFYNGTELAACVIRYPIAEELPVFTDFYHELSENAFEWFCTELCEKRKKEYDRVKDSDCRYSEKVYRYSLDFSAKEERAGRLAVCCSAILKRGKQEELSVLSEIQIWDTAMQLIIKDKKRNGRPRTKK